MPLHRPRVGKQSVKAMGRMVDSKANDRILLTSSSLTSLEDWDLADNNIFLSKL